MKRFNNLLADLDLGRRGVEFGPLDRPLVPKSLGPVVYVDYASTEAVKAKGYREDGGGTVRPENICEIDLVAGERPLKEDGPFFYAVASHVIEHVPDVIGWLREIAEALTRDGLIALAIPDKRYTFDIHRPVSTTGEIVQSWLEKRTRPTARQIFDTCAMTVEIPCHEIWAGRTDGPPMIGENALTLAYDQCVEQMSSGRYIDSHCWVFTPASFLDILADLIRLQILPLEIEKFVGTERGELEFYVRFRAAGADPMATIHAARESLRQSEADNARPVPAARPQRPWFKRAWTKSKRTLRAASRRGFHFDLGRKAT